MNTRDQSPEAQAELAVAIAELAALVELYADGHETLCLRGVAEMPEDTARRLLGLAVASLANSLDSP